LAPSQRHYPEDGKRRKAAMSAKELRPEDFFLNTELERKFALIGLAFVAQSLETEHTKTHEALNDDYNPHGLPTLELDQETFVTWATTVAKLVDFKIDESNATSTLGLLNHRVENLIRKLVVDSVTDQIDGWIAEHLEGITAADVYNATSTVARPESE
jgi:hypothetical protein